MGGGGDKDWGKREGGANTRGKKKKLRQNHLRCTDIFIAGSHTRRTPQQAEGKKRTARGERAGVRAVTPGAVQKKKAKYCFQKNTRRKKGGYQLYTPLSKRQIMPQEIAPGHRLQLQTA